MRKVKVGIIGCGNISGIYGKICSGMEILELAACADLIPERAKAFAGTYSVPKAVSPRELLADPEIGIVLNLTIPKVHGEVGLAALEAGKSVYNEKPVAVKREDGLKMLKIAARKNLLVGGAPDTFLGGGHQTCRKIVDDGVIGEPVAATAFMLCHGHESWHPDPEFYYKVGGGPMFDMGPYYLTALVNLLGPVASVAGSARKTFAKRLITSEQKKGTEIVVDVPTHIAGIMNFSSGAVGTIVTSFDVWAADVPRIEVYGSLGSLSVPDPNGFGGPVRVRLAADSEWREVPLSHGYAENSRGLGVADMASAILTGRKARAGGELAYHVLDLMHAFHDSSDRGEHVRMKSTCARPAPLPGDLAPGKID